MIFTLTSGTMNTILCYLRLTDLPREGFVLTSGYVFSRHSRHTADGLVCYDMNFHIINLGVGLTFPPQPKHFGISA